jgi:hypothetical protein
MLMLAALCSSTALATTLSYSDTLALTATNFAYGAVGTTLELQKFDTSLGTLNSILLEFQITDLYSLQLSAGATEAIYEAGFLVGVRGRMRGPNNASPTFTFISYFASTNIGVNDITVPASTTNPTVFTNAPGTTQSGSTSITSSSFGAWTGSLGQFVTLQVDGLQNTSGVSSNPVIIGTGSVGAYAQVTYDYTPSAPPPVPEPATMGLMGGALVGLAVLGKRFRR